MSYVAEKCDQHLKWNTLLKQWAILNKWVEWMIRWLTHNTVTYRHLHLILHKDLLINTYTTCAQTDSPSWSPISRQTLGPLRKTTTSIYHKRRTWIWITGFWDLQKKKTFFVIWHVLLKMHNPFDNTCGSKLKWTSCYTGCCHEL